MSKDFGEFGGEPIVYQNDLAACTQLLIYRRHKKTAQRAGHLPSMNHCPWVTTALLPMPVCEITAVLDSVPSTPDGF